MKEQTRYNRQVLLPEIGSRGQQKLDSSKVLVVGAGGLGCPALQYLVAAGIGTIGIADMDVVSQSNLNRQTLYSPLDIGKNKALVARTRLETFNPEVKIQAYSKGLNPDNAKTIIQDYDIIVDATDNFEARYLINDACVQLNKPWVFGAIYKFEGKWGVFNYQDGPSYRCMFPKAPNLSSVPNCNQIGVLGIVPGIIGSFQANEVLRMLLFPDPVHSGKINYLNLQTNALQSVKLETNAREIAMAKSVDISSYNYASFCGLPTGVNTIDLNALTHLDETFFIDVREAFETPKVKCLNLLNIPLGSLEQSLSKLNTNDTYVLFCQSGIRSKKGAKILMDQGFKHVFSLNQGAEQLMQFTTNNKAIAE